MQNEEAAGPALREFIVRAALNLFALFALVVGAVNVPDLILSLMP